MISQIIGCICKNMCYNMKQCVYREDKMGNYKDLLLPENKDVIKNHSFFSGLNDKEITEFINFSKPDFLELAPEEIVSMQTGTEPRLGVVLTGDIKLYSIDYDGNKTVINALHGKGTVGSMHFMMERYNLLFEIVADTESKLALFSPSSLLVTNEQAAALQHKVFVNVVMSQRELFIRLSEHLLCLSQKSIRDKIMRYLKIQSEHCRAYEFDVPFTREEFASFLAVDRASLSRSLGELKREGIIDFRKNHFKILTTQHFQF